MQLHGTSRIFAPVLFTLHCRCATRCVAPFRPDPIEAWRQASGRVRSIGRVQLEGPADIKAVRAENLARVLLPSDAGSRRAPPPAPHASQSSNDPLQRRGPPSEESVAVDITVEDLSVQLAIEESTRHSYWNSVALEQARGANARASEALLRSQTPEPGPRLLCVVFKRRPAAIREAVLDDPAFDSTRSALAQHNFPVELEGGGKVLTKPEHYEAGLEAMRLLGKRLEPNHVLVEEESYDDLIRAGAASASLIPLGDPPLLSRSAVVPPCAGSGIARRQRGLPDEDCYLGTAKEKAAVAHAKNRRWWQWQGLAGGGPGAHARPLGLE
jgi:hypothetical protein